MFFIYHRAGRIPVLPALAAAGAIVIVSGIAVTILAIVGVVGFGTRLLRTFGLVGTGAPASNGDDVIEGVVMNANNHTEPPTLATPSG
jgi:hypothetical protein